MNQDDFKQLLDEALEPIKQKQESHSADLANIASKLENHSAALVSIESKLDAYGDMILHGLHYTSPAGLRFNN